MESVEGINPKTLSARLKELERNGLIARKVYRENPPRVEYFLTEKGRALKPVLEQMGDFSLRYWARDVLKDGKPRTWETVYGKSSGIT